MKGLVVVCFVQVDACQEKAGIGVARIKQVECLQFLVWMDPPGLSQEKTLPDKGSNRLMVDL